MSAKGAGAGNEENGKETPTAPSTVPPPPLSTSISQSDLETLRKKSDKIFQHYNYRAAQKVLTKQPFLSKIQGDGFVLAKEITNRLNLSDVRSKKIRCHARSLLNQHALTLADGLNNIPIDENEPYYFFVRYKTTGGNSYYFNLDFYLPNRNNDSTHPKQPKIIREIVHFSVHSNPFQPLYLKDKSGVLTDEVDLSGVSKISGKPSPTDFNGMIHGYESTYISATDKPLRKFLMLLHRRVANTRTNAQLTNADYRKEFVLVSQRSKTANKSLHPLSTLFMEICIEVLQGYFDSNYNVSTFTTVYDGPKTPYAMVKANTLASIINKDNEKGIDWVRLKAQKENLGSEIAARIKQTAVGMKMQALDLFVKSYYNGRYDYNIQFNNAYPITSCLKDISILTVKSSDDGQTVNFSLHFHFRWDKDNNYDTKLLSSISFKNNGQVTVGNKPYKGYFFLKEYLPVTNSASIRYYTMSGTKISPIYQTGDLTSISVAFGDLAAQVISDFIAKGYTPFASSYYDCSGIGKYDHNPVAPPADQAKKLPKYGGRRTRALSKKSRLTRKNKRRS